MPQTHLPLPRVVAFDPGGTTGFAVFAYSRLREWGSFPTFEKLEELINHGVSQVVYEEVKARSLSFDDIGIRVSGVIEFLSWRSEVKRIRQKPTILTGMYRLVDFKDFPEADIHAKEAILHGVYFLASTAKVLTLPITAKSLISP